MRLPTLVLDRFIKKINANWKTSKCTYSKLCDADDHDMCMDLMKVQISRWRTNGEILNIQRRTSSVLCGYK